MLGYVSYRKLIHTTYAQQQLGYDTDQVLHLAATLQLLAIVLACLVTSIMFCCFWEFASCLVRGMTILLMLRYTYSVCFSIKTNYNFGSEYDSAD